MMQQTHDGGDDSFGVDIDPEIITLVSDDDQEADFALLGLLELQDVQFAALVPAEQLDSDTDEAVELYVFEYRKGDKGERIFEAIADEALEQAVFDAAVALLNANSEE